MPLDFTVSGTGGKKLAAPQGKAAAPQGKAAAPQGKAAAPQGSSTGLDFSAPKGGGAPKAAAKKKGSGLFGALGQVKDLVVGAGPGLIRLGGGLLKELAPTNPFTAKHDPTSMGWQGVEKKMPLTGSILESTARTARQIPDTAVAVRPGGPGFGQSNLGHQIRDEGYLHTGLAKVGDASLLLGGVGLIGKAATGGKLAQASKLERLAAATSQVAGAGKKADYVKLVAKADEAAKAGDVTRAADLTAAAKQVLDAAELRTGVAGAGKATQGIEKATEAAFKGARFGDRAGALPFLPTQKLLGAAGKGVGLAARSERLAPVMARATAAMDRLARRQEVGDLYHETVRAPFEAEMYNWYERHGLEDVARKLDRDEQAAVYIARMTREGLDPTVRELLDAVDELDPDVRPDALREIFPDGEVTPEQYALARAFDEGTLDPKQAAKMQDAADRIGAAQGQRQTTRYETGRGTSRPLSDDALEARRQRAAGESADWDAETAVANATRGTQRRLAGIRGELDELNTAGDDVPPVPMSRAQERATGKLAERTRRRAATVAGETRRGEQTMQSAAREVDRTQTRAGNRTGQVIGRARGRLEEAGQLQTGVEARARAEALKARRLAKAADAAEAKAAKPAAMTHKTGDSVRLDGDNRLWTVKKVNDDGTVALHRPDAIHRTEKTVQASELRASKAAAKQETPAKAAKPAAMTPDETPARDAERVLDEKIGKQITERDAAKAKYDEVRTRRPAPEHAEYERVDTPDGKLPAKELKPGDKFVPPYDPSAVTATHTYTVTKVEKAGRFIKITTKDERGFTVEHEYGPTKKIDTFRPTDRFDTQSDAGNAAYQAHLKELAASADVLRQKGDAVRASMAERRAPYEAKAETPAPKPEAKPAPAPKITAAGRAAAKRAEADEAAASAAKLKGVKAPDMHKVRSDVNLDAQRANVANTAEGATTGRLLAKQVEDQRAAVTKAQKQLDAAQSQERATLDKFERENQARADKKQQKRFETLQQREADALAKLAEQAEAARASVEAAPPQDRPALRVNERAKAFALSLAEAHPEHATRFEALAGDIATTSAALRGKGIEPEYIFGGAELGDTPSVPRTAKLRRPQQLQSERTRVKGALSRSVKAQGEKFAKETQQILNNEFRGKLQERMGSTVKDELGGAAGKFDTGEALAAKLDEAGLVAWDPKTGKLLDPADVDASSAVLDKHLYEAVTKWTAVKDPNLALKAYDKLTGGWKHTVLALSPRWHVGNIVGNAALATLGAGLSPAQIAGNIGEARRLVKAFEAGADVPAEHLSALQRILAAGYHNPDLATIENARAVGRLINKSYHFNSYVDSVNRTMVYLAKHKGGVSSEAAVSMALKAAGDFSKMTPFERNVVRRVIPFYAWQRHITRLALSLPIEHPSRVVWTLHLADLQNDLYPDPGADNEFNEGTIPLPGGKRLNVRAFFPFSSSFWTDPSYRSGGYQVNPVLKTGFAAATGFNLGKMKPVSGKFRGKNPSGFGAPIGALPPKALAEFTAQQLPQVTTARDLVAGDAPVRYDTGEPRKVGPGATKKGAKPTLTGRKRGQTVARFFGVPVPEVETKSTTKK